MSLFSDADASLVKKVNLLNLSIQNFRNLTDLHLLLLPGINLIIGENGSGKSSVLEAVYLLGVGRSFRSRQRKSYIAFHQSKMTIISQLVDSKAKNITLGLSKSLFGPAVLRLAGENSCLADVARKLPLQLICANTFDLLVAGPEVRRQFMDWGMFYVEHSYGELWQRFEKVLKQRNALLRSKENKSALLHFWDKEFILLSEQLSSKRSAFCAQLIPILSQVIHRLLPEFSIEIAYSPGWKGSLAENLQTDAARDVMSGYTHSGPQRGDLICKVNGLPAAHVFSRGQQKLLVCALLLARGQWLYEYTQKKCIYLVDDLPSELDLPNRHLVMQLLIEQETQVFVTSIDIASMADALSAVDYHIISLKAGCST